MKKLVFVSIYFLFSCLFSCTEKSREKTSDSFDSTVLDEKSADSSNELVADTLNSGDGTKSMTPADPIQGTSTSENGLSTDVGGVVPSDSTE